MSGTRSLSAARPRVPLLALGRFARLLLGVLLAAVIVVVPTGCASATTTGQARTAITDGLEAAGSAVATASLTVTLLDEHRTTAPVADTTLLDQIRVLEEASSALTTLVPPAALATSQQEGMTAVGAAQESVVAARSWVTGESSDGAPATATEVIEALDGAAAAIDDALAGVGS